MAVQKFVLKSNIQPNKLAEAAKTLQEATGVPQAKWLEQLNQGGPIPLLLETDAAKRLIDSLGAIESNVRLTQIKESPLLPIRDAFDKIKLPDGVQPPRTIEDFRKVVGDSEGSSPEITRLKQFSQYTGLVHPYVAAVLSLHDVKVLKQMDESEIKSLLQDADIAESLIEKELPKIQYFKNQSNGTVPTEVEYVLKTAIPEDFAKGLRQEGILTLVDVRHKWLSQKKLPWQEREWAQDLVKFARLSAFTPDLEVTRALIKRNKTNLQSVAALSNEEIKSIATQEKVSEAQVEQSRYQARQLRNQVASVTRALYRPASAPLRSKSTASTSGDLQDLIDDPDLRPSTGDSCAGCGTCDDALSEAAYLLDLFAFAGYRFGIGLPEIEAQLHRNFAGLVIDCSVENASVPTAQICAEVLERFITVKDGSLDTSEKIRDRLKSNGDQAYSRLETSLVNFLAQSIGFTATALAEYVQLLSIASPDTSQTKKLNQHQQTLGAPAGTLPSAIKTALQTLVNAPVTVVSSVLAGADFTANALNIVRSKQLDWRIQREDQILATLDTPPDLSNNRETERNTFSDAGKQSILNAWSTVLPEYVQALQGLTSEISGISSNQLIKDLQFPLAHGSCEPQTRTHEAVLAMQRFILEKLLRSEDLVGLEDIDWSDYSKYDTWSGIQVNKLYKELSFDIQELGRNLWLFDTERQEIQDLLPDPFGLDVYYRDPRLDGGRGTEAEEFKFRFGALKLISQVNNLSSYNDGGVQLSKSLSGFHAQVWEAIPLPEQKPTLNNLGNGSYEYQLYIRASKAETANSLSYSDWQKLQGEILKVLNLGKEYTDRKTGTEPLWHLNTRYNPNNNTEIIRKPYLHLLAFYVLPRMWGKFYYITQDYLRSIQFFHLIFNEEHISSTSRGFAFLYLRQRSTSASTNVRNIYDVELRDIKYLLARSYLDWADLEFRRHTSEGRSQAQLLYEKVLLLYGYCFEADDSKKPSCQGNCGQVIGNIEVQILERLYFAASPGLTGAFDRARKDIRTKQGWEDLEKQINDLIKQSLPREEATQRATKFIDQAIAQAHQTASLTFGKINENVDNFYSNSALGQRVEDQIIASSSRDPLYQTGFGLGRDELIIPGEDFGPGLGNSSNGGQVNPGGRLGEGQDGIGRGGEIPDRFVDPSDGRPFDDDPFQDRPPGFSDPSPVPSFLAAKELCVPENPRVSAFIKRACLGLSLIKECRNPLGYREEDIPIFRFSTLILMAKSFADLAYNAEQDFIRFTQAADAGELNLIKETQVLTVSQATVSLNQTMVQQAAVQQDVTQFQRNRVDKQFEQVASQIAEGTTSKEQRALDAMGQTKATQEVMTAVAGIGVLAAFLGAGIGASVATGGGGAPVVAAIGAATLPAVMSAIGSATGVSQTEAQIAQLQNSINQRLDELSRTRALLNIDKDIAATNQTIALLGTKIAEQQLAIAQTNARFAVAVVGFLQSRFFSSQRLNWMADIARENYRIFLGYAVEAAYMAQRALEFERPPQKLNTIRFDYWKESDRGVMGVDRLKVDLATLENEKLSGESRKHQITRAISLAQIAPLELTAFRQTGELSLMTLEEWFERDFPTHYLRLIKSVSVNIVALVPPLESVKAMLTHLGTSRTLQRHAVGATAFFDTVTIKRLPESIAISSPVGATGLFTPLQPENQYLNPFEGNGLEGSWYLEMPKHSNSGLNYDTIMDVQLVIQYTAMEDKNKRPVYSLTAQGAATYSLNLNFPDAFYRLHNPVFEPGENPYVATFEVDESILAPNQNNRRLRTITIYFEREAGSRKRPLVSLDYQNQPGATKQPIFSERLASPEGGIRLTVDNQLAGLWTVLFINDEAKWNSSSQWNSLSDSEKLESSLFARNNEGQIILQNNHPKLELKWVKDVLIMFEYDYVRA